MVVVVMVVVGATGTHTVQLGQTSLCTELDGWDAQAVILDGTCTTSKVDGRVDVRGSGIEGILEEVQHHARERADGCRRLDLGDDLFGQQLDGPSRCHEAVDMARAALGVALGGQDARMHD
jgi:hypothetical protein